MPAWKADKLLEFQKADQVDLAAVGEETGILFESTEMLDEAVLHLDKIRKEKVEKGDADEGVPKASDSHSSQSKDQDMSDEKGSDDLKEKKTNSVPAGNAQSNPNALGSHMQKIHALVVCPSTKGYTDQQMIAGRVLQASYSWLNRDRDDVGTHKERRLARAGPALTAAISPILFADQQLDLKQQAELLPLTYVAQYTPLYVRPEHPTTANAMTFKGEEADRLPLCSDLLHQWAMGLAKGNPTALTRIDPLSSPDLLFPMPKRSSPLYT